MIKILDDDTVAKIAAGEVVESPASLVKELVENSLDARAKKISISFRGGGKEYISVADDGEGMTEEDARLAILSHSTSKIEKIEDISALTTLGFRGEALHSIAKVSIMEIHTRKDDGVHLRIEGGELLEAIPEPRERGTTVTVQNLFFNLPARKKFLKTTYTEAEKIRRTVIGLAIAYPEVSFSLFHNHTVILEVQAGTFSDRVNQVLGEDVIREMVTLDYEEDGITLSGYISKPEHLKERGRVEHIFINRRYVRNNLIRSAIRNGYGIPTRDRLPSFVINLNIDGQALDVNVHPRKEEVRFNNENLLYSTLFKAVRETLGIGTRIVSESQIEWEGEPSAFWQLHNSYIFAQTKKGVLIVDQHAASERILYERILLTLPAGQKLLFPLIVVLSQREYEIFKKLKDGLQKFGFEMGEFGHRTIRITAVSSFLGDLNADRFKEMLYEIKDAKPFSNIVRILACKGAIKNGDKLSPQEMNRLIDELFASENPYFCPHGRPTIIRWSIEELDRRFGR